MTTLLLVIRRRAGMFDWVVRHVDRDLLGGAEASVADCLRSGASVAFLELEGIEFEVNYRGTRAGPYAPARLVGEAEEVADHVRELALER